MSNLADQPRTAGDAQGKDLGDEYLLYDRENDRVHVLNATAREILLLCDGSRSIEKIAAVLIDRHGIDRETAIRDTSETVDRLRELNVLRARA